MQTLTKLTLGILLCLLSMTVALAQSSTIPHQVCAECIRKNMEYLASDDLRGRKSGSEDEHRAAVYIGKQLKAYGIQPANPVGFVQKASLTQRTITAAPTIIFTAPDAKSPTTLTFGKDFLTVDLVSTQFSGPL